MCVGVVWVRTRCVCLRTCVLSCVPVDSLCAQVISYSVYEMQYIDFDMYWTVYDAVGTVASPSVHHKLRWEIDGHSGVT